MKSTKAQPLCLVCVGAELMGAESSWGVPGVGSIRGEGAELLMMLKITVRYRKSEGNGEYRKRKKLILGGELIMSHFPSPFFLLLLPSSPKYSGKFMYHQEIEAEHQVRNEKCGCEWNNWQATRVEPKYQIQACCSECEVYRAS